MTLLSLPDRLVPIELPTRRRRVFRIVAMTGSVAVCLVLRALVLVWVAGKSIFVNTNVRQCLYFALSLSYMYDLAEQLLRQRTDAWMGLDVLKHSINSARFCFFCGYHCHIDHPQQEPNPPVSSPPYLISIVRCQWEMLALVGYWGLLVALPSSIVLAYNRVAPLSTSSYSESRARNSLCLSRSSPEEQPLITGTRGQFADSSTFSTSRPSVHL